MVKKDEKTTHFFFFIFIAIPRNSKAMLRGAF